MKSRGQSCSTRRHFHSVYWSGVSGAEAARYERENPRLIFLWWKHSIAVLHGAKAQLKTNTGAVSRWLFVHITVLCEMSSHLAWNLKKPLSINNKVWHVKFLPCQHQIVCLSIMICWSCLVLNCIIKHELQPTTLISKHHYSTCYVGIRLHKSRLTSPTDFPIQSNLKETQLPKVTHSHEDK